MSSRWRVKRPPQPPITPALRRTQSHSTGKPAWVIAISIIFAYFAVSSIVSSLLFSRLLSATDRADSVDIGFRLAAAVVTLIAVVALFRLKRSALPLWIAVLVVGF